MANQSEKIQQAFGTTLRNKAIMILYRNGLKQTEIARLLTVRNHPMTKQQVNDIIKRFNHGN